MDITYYFIKECMDVFWIIVTKAEIINVQYQKININ